MRRILIVRMGSLGDIIHTLPAAATLRAAFPDAEIGWVVERRWLPILERNPHLTRLHPVETRARWLGREGAWRSLIESLGELRRRRYDCALDFQGLIKSAVVARLSGAATVVGFDRAELREKISWLFYTARARFPANGRPAHVVERNLALAAAIGARAPVLDFCCAPPPEDVEQVRGITAGLGKFAILSPGAGWAAKRWPEAAYAALAQRINGELGWRVVINCGPSGELMALVRDAALLVAGDTGPLHLAMACGTPVVAIFGPTDPVRNGPYGTASRVVRAPGAVTTYSRGAGRQAIEAVTVEEVFRAVKELVAAP